MSQRITAKNIQGMLKRYTDAASTLGFDCSGVEVGNPYGLMYYVYRSVEYRAIHDLPGFDAHVSFVTLREVYEALALASRTLESVAMKLNETSAA